VTRAAASTPIVPVPEALPIAPSQRLPLIHHTLREAQVAYVELRYEGRGMTGGYTLRLQDPHRCDRVWDRVDQPTQQALMGFLWQLVLLRYPLWDQGPGSFGVLAWDVRADHIRHFHHERTIEVKTSLIEGL
jgi:hypothetical protein